MSSKDNSYANTDKKTLFLSDDVDNESIGKLTWNILHNIEATKNFVKGDFL